MNQLRTNNEEVDEVKAHHQRSKESLIMMVDDEPILMAVVQTFLEERGYSRFITCEDSTKAIALIEKNLPDVLLLDLVMPKVSGFEILKMLKENASTRHLPVIVLTSSGDSGTKLKALELGATDFLAKPVDPSELVLRLRNTLTVKAYQDRLENFDQLTGLYNRRQFIKRLEWAIRRKQSTAQHHCVFIIGLDRFKKINDSLSNEVGDEILIQVGARLSDFIEEERLGKSAAARLGSDEFAMLFDHESAVANALRAKALLRVISLPYYVNETEVNLTATVGFVSTADVKASDELLQKASIAAQIAKKTRRGGYLPYSPSIDTQAAEMFKLESDLRSALANDELEVFYQPKVNAKNNQIMGMEALLRWHLDGELIPPDRFIPIAEDVGLIGQIGNWVIKKACLQNKELEKSGIDCVVSVNVSGLQISDTKIVAIIKDALQNSGLAPNKLIIEITESLVMEDLERGLQVLEAIRDIGVSVSIDDFGTGYSSLSYLKKFPISELKIDQSFLRGFPANDEDTAIVRAIIALAHSLDLYVTAEGVETQEQVNGLKNISCELLQGYYFSKPLAFDDFKAYYLDYQVAH